MWLHSSSKTNSCYDAVLMQQLSNRSWKLVFGSGSTVILPNRQLPLIRGFMKLGSHKQIKAPAGYCSCSSVSTESQTRALTAAHRKKRVATSNVTTNSSSSSSHARPGTLLGCSTNNHPAMNVRAHGSWVRTLSSTPHTTRCIDVVC